MKKTIAIGIFSFLLFYAFTLQAGWKDVTGYWVTIDDESGEKESIVKITKEDGKVQGKVVKLLKQPGSKCTECEGKRKNEPIKGMKIMWGMTPDKDEGVWQDGTILDPDNGEKYDCKIWTESGGDKLKVRGYVAFFHRTQTWKRTEKPDAESEEGK